MAHLWTYEEVLAATNGRPVGDTPEGVNGISIDTRTLQPGDAFFAIKGDRVDGHDYLAAAMSAGAALAVVDESRLVALGRLKLPLIVVNDVLEAMSHLGEVARMRTKAQIIAVTGSVGKTSTKEMLRTVLSASGKVHAAVASFNNHWGVPLTLARMPVDARYGVFEIGMNHAGEIASLVKLVRPHIAMVTNVAAAHIGAFETVDDIARAKGEIFSGVVPGGYGIINHDDRRYPLLRQLAVDAGIEHIYSFGKKRGSDFWLRKSDIDMDGSRVNVRINGKDAEYRLKVAGMHMALNSVATLGAADLVGGDFEKGVDVLRSVKPETGRGNRVVINRSGGGKILVIDESYNANPASMDAALKVLGAFDEKAAKRRIAVLGDMLELGRQSKKLHEGLVRPIVAAKVDLVFLVGPEMEYLAKILPKERLGGHFPTADKLEAKLKTRLKTGDVVVIKGSKRIGLAGIADAIAKSFIHTEAA